MNCAKLMAMCYSESERCVLMKGEQASPLLSSPSLCNPFISAGGM